MSPLWIKSKLFNLNKWFGSNIYSKNGAKCSISVFEEELLFVWSRAAAGEKISWQFVVVQLFFLSVNFYFNSFLPFFSVCESLFGSFNSRKCSLLTWSVLFLFLCSLASVSFVCVSDSLFLTLKWFWCAQRSARRRLAAAVVVIFVVPVVIVDNSPSSENQRPSQKTPKLGRVRTSAETGIDKLSNKPRTKCSKDSVRVPVELPPLHWCEFHSSSNKKKMSHKDLT